MNIATDSMVIEVDRRHKTCIWRDVLAAISLSNRDMIWEWLKEPVDEEVRWPLRLELRHALIDEALLG